jgi:hypothetical protein
MARTLRMVTARLSRRQHSGSGGYPVIYVVESIHFNDTVKISFAAAVSRWHEVEKAGKEQPFTPHTSKFLTLNLSSQK